MKMSTYATRHECTRSLLTMALTSSEAVCKSKSTSADLSSSAAGGTRCAHERSESAARLVLGSTSPLSPSGPQLVQIRCDSKCSESITHVIMLSMPPSPATLTVRVFRTRCSIWLATGLGLGLG